MSEDSEEVHPKQIVVEEYDVEKVAMNSALGRLWRTWRRKPVRSPLIPFNANVREERGQNLIDDKDRDEEDE